MNVEYFYLYYLVAAISLFLIAVSMASSSYTNNQLSTIEVLVIASVSLTYLIAMTRQDGVDYAIYVSNYYTNYPGIPDFGFELFISPFRSLGIRFEFVVIFIGIVTLVALKSASAYFNVRYSSVLTLYFLHLAIVRDFAQLRSGFAISLVIYGLTLRTQKFKWLMYLVGASMHYSIAIFVIAYEFCRVISWFSSDKRQVISVIVASLLILIISSFLPQFYFLDDRIELYLSWADENYGLPVSQFYAISFHFFLLVLCCFSRQSWWLDIKIRTIVYLQILGVVFFIAFKDVSIIAFRVSGAMLSLYPIMIAYVLMHLRLRVCGCSVARFSAAVIFLVIGTVLLFRQGSYEIVQSIGFGSYPSQFY